MKKRNYKLILLFLFVCVSPVINVALKATLTETNLEYERIKTELNSSAELNNSLNMKINELASLDRIRTVAENYGLAYNNSNIKNVE